MKIQPTLVKRGVRRVFHSNSRKPQINGNQNEQKSDLKSQSPL